MSRDAGDENLTSNDKISSSMNNNNEYRYKKKKGNLVESHEIKVERKKERIHKRE